MNVNTRNEDVSDFLEIPDNVWDDERNRNRPSANAGHAMSDAPRTPPPTACLNIRVIYNNGFIQSSAGGNAAIALQRAKDVVAEAENILNTKFSTPNQLGSRITFNIVGGGKY